MRQEGRFVLGGILGMPHTFAGILVGQRLGRRLLFCDTVEWGLGTRIAKQLLERGRERKTSHFHDFGLSRGVTWLEPVLSVELTYSEVMEAGCVIPCIAGSSKVNAKTGVVCRSRTRSGPRAGRPTR